MDDYLSIDEELPTDEYIPLPEWAEDVLACAPEFDDDGRLLYKAECDDRIPRLERDLGPDTWPMGEPSPIVEKIREGRNIIVDTGRDMLTHPTSTLYNMALPFKLPVSFIKSLPFTYGGDLLIGDTMRDWDENIAEFGDHMLHNPKDWYHILNGARMEMMDSPSNLATLKRLSKPRKRGHRK